ncbi:DHHW family protein [Sporosarcina sp. CAU 1771]
MSKKIFVALFLLFIGTMFVFSVVGEDKTFSEQENRPLSQKPKFTWDRFVSGKYTSEFETYLSDQFPWKNGWVGIKAKAEKTLGKKENNNVLFGADGYLLERFTNVGKQLWRNTQLLNEFSKQTTIEKTYVVLAPTAAGIYPEKLPKFATSLDQNLLLNEIKLDLTKDNLFINVYNSLISHKDEGIYFKTDHHWTMRGAYYAYVDVAKAMGFEPLEIEDFKFEVVSEDFYGTLYSKASAYDAKPDAIELFTPKKSVESKVTYEDGTISDSLFEMGHLKTKDKYAVFLDGNHSLVKIETSAGSGRKLAVVKDSYAHALLPFLANHYDEIHVLDLRYNKMPMRSYLEEHAIEEVLFLYNLPNFTVDTNLLLIQ